MQTQSAHEMFSWALFFVPCHFGVSDRAVAGMSSLEDVRRKAFAAKLTEGPVVAR